MKFATITLFLAGLAIAMPSPQPQAASPISDAISAKIESYLADKIRSIDSAQVAEQAMAELQPAIAKALVDYAGTIKKAQWNVVEAAQRAALEKRDPQATTVAATGGPMAAASAELRKVSEDVGVSIGTMIGRLFILLLGLSSPCTFFPLPYASYVHFSFFFICLPSLFLPHTN